MGKYLVEQLMEWNTKYHRHGPIEHRSLGESPAIGAELLVKALDRKDRRLLYVTIWGRSEHSDRSIIAHIKAGEGS